MSSIPYISVQPDYLDVLQDVREAKISSEKAWLSVYASNAPDASLHARVAVNRNADGSAQLKSDTSAIDLQPISYGINVSVVGKGIPTPTPSQSARSMYRRQDQICQQAVDVRFPKFSRQLVSPSLKSYGITAFDVSPTSNGLYVAGGDDGDLVVGTLAGIQPPMEESMQVDGMSELEQRAQRRMAHLAAEREAQNTLRLTGHVGDLRSARFFPSGEVILTTSSDMSVRIFSARENSNPRTFTGHKRAVLTSEILGRGRQVITGGADGTVRLWDLAKGAQLTSYSMPRFSAANALAFPRPEQGSVLGVALASGGVQLVDVRVAPPPLSSSSDPEIQVEHPSLTGAGVAAALTHFPPSHFDPPPSPQVRWNGERRPAGGLQALSWASDPNHMVAGSSKGVFSLIDPRMLSGDQDIPSDQAVVAAWERSPAPVTDVQALSGGEYLASSADGLPHRARIPTTTTSDDTPLAPQVLKEFAGWDTLPANAIRLDHLGHAVVAGADGYVRKY